MLDKEFYFEMLVKRDHLDCSTYVKVDSSSDKKAFQIYIAARRMLNKKGKQVFNSSPAEKTLTFMSCLK